MLARCSRGTRLILARYSLDARSVLARYLLSTRSVLGVVDGAQARVLESEHMLVLARSFV